MQVVSFTGPVTATNTWKIGYSAEQHKTVIDDVCHFLNNSSIEIDDIQTNYFMIDHPNCPSETWVEYLICYSEK